MKSYTDIEQSRKLANILPLETADMCYFNGDVGKISIGEWKHNTHDKDDVPCWSLAALLNVLPSGYVIVKNYHSLYFVESRDHSKSTKVFNNPIDASCEMIIKLHELNLL